MSVGSNLTVCLLNFKRPGNLRVIVKALKEQTITPHLFLWDNGSEPADCEVDWLVRSSCNRQCWPRWFMAAHAETEFVAVLDDDLCPVERSLLMDLVEELIRHRNPGTIVGPYGVVLDSRHSYRACSRARISDDGTVAADIIKGRLVVARTSEIRGRLPLIGASSLHDDIVVSGLLADGRQRPHLWARAAAKKLRELPEPCAVWKRAGHYQEREKVRRIYFP